MRRMILACVLGTACGGDATEGKPAGGESGDTDGSTGVVTASAGTISAGESQGTIGSTGSTTASTTADSQSTTASDSMASDGTGVSATDPSDGGSTGPIECEQTDTEPNDDEDMTISAGDADCETGPQTFSGTLDGSSADADWFQSFFSWNQACMMNDAVVTVQVDSDLEVCVYYDCLGGGSPDEVCQSGSSPHSSPGARQGCCGTGDVSLAYACGNGDNDALIYMSVAGAKGNECRNYEATFEISDDEILM